MPSVASDCDANSQKLVTFAPQPSPARSLTIRSIAKSTSSRPSKLAWCEPLREAGGNSTRRSPFHRKTTRTTPRS